MLRIFVADLHLQAQDQARLGDFLRGFGARSELYVLGDLFDLWLGDDLDLPRFQPAVAALREYAERGGVAHVMVGNHDFLLGAAFFEQTRARPLPDPSLVEHAGQRLLLSHGDALCLADRDYQAFRQRIRQPQFVAQFLAQPAAQRLALARQFQDASRAATAQKTVAMMDVDAAAAAAALADCGAALLVHGHTHRPGLHRLPAGRRLVLGPWFGQESALIWPAAGPPQPLNLGCSAADLAG